MRNAVLGVSVGLVACSGPAVPAPPRPVSTVPVAPAAHPPPPAFHRQCSGGTSPRSSKHAKVYDFTPVPLTATADGPRFAESSVSWPARTPVAMHDMVSRADVGLRRCWFWAQVKDGLGETTLHATFEVDPWGEVSNVHVDPAGAEDLERCVEEQLLAAHTLRVATRPTRVAIDLRFVLVDQPPWLATPERPDPIETSPPSKLCAPVLDGRFDEVAIVAPLVLSDRSSSRDYTRHNGRLVISPTVGFSVCQEERDELNKVDIRRGMRSNLGAFGACHAAAQARIPDLAGELAITLAMHPDGAARADVAGAGDDELRDCVRAAAEEIWWGAHDAEIVAHWFFTLDRAADTPAPEPATECLRRAAAFAAAAERTPWPHDPIVLDALDALVAEAAVREPVTAEACLADVMPKIHAVIGRGLGAGSFERSYLERMDVIERVMPIADRITPGGELALLHAQGLALRDPAAAIAELRALGTLEAKELADQLTADPDILGARCGR